MYHFFSIIIPVYNVSPYLRECLDSVLAQTFTDWEAICVDDGSTDGSGAILDEYAAQDERFIVIHQQNKGVASARNVALSVAKGEWMGFLDSDDVYRESLLETASCSLAHYPDADVIRFKMVEYGEGERPIWGDGAHTIKITETSAFIPKDAYIGNFPERFYRGAKFRKILFPRLRRGEDRVWLANAVMVTDMMLDIDYVGYGYLQRPGSAIHQGFTCEMLQCHLAWQRSALNVFTTRAAKVVDEKLVRYAILSITEDFSRVFFCEANSLGRRTVWGQWLSAMKEIRSEPYVRKWNKFAMMLVCLSRSRAIAWIVFYLPNWLKLHGIHR